MKIVFTIFAVVIIPALSLCMVPFQDHISKSIKTTFQESTYLNPGFKSRMNAEEFEKVTQQVAKFIPQENASSWDAHDAELIEKFSAKTEKEKKQIGHIWALYWLATEQDSLWKKDPKDWKVGLLQQLHARLTVLTCPKSKGEFRKKDGIKEHKCFQQDKAYQACKTGFNSWTSVYNKEKKRYFSTDISFRSDYSLIESASKNDGIVMNEPCIEKLIESGGARFLIPRYENVLITKLDVILQVFEIFTDITENNDWNKQSFLNKTIFNGFYGWYKAPFSKNNIQNAEALFNFLKTNVNDLQKFKSACFLTTAIGMLYPWDRANRKMIRLLATCGLHHEGKSPNFFVKKYTRKNGTKEFVKECVPNFLIRQLVEKLNPKNIHGSVFNQLLQIFEGLCEQQEEKKPELSEQDETKKLVEANSLAQEVVKSDLNNDSYGESDERDAREIYYDAEDNNEDALEEKNTPQANSGTSTSSEKVILKEEPIIDQFHKKNEKFLEFLKNKREEFLKTQENNAPLSASDFVDYLRQKPTLEKNFFENYLEKENLLMKEHKNNTPSINLIKENLLMKNPSLINKLYGWGRVGFKKIVLPPFSWLNDAFMHIVHRFQ